jgi:two-component system response regulator NreC
MAAHPPLAPPREASATAAPGSPIRVFLPEDRDPAPHGLRALLDDDCRVRVIAQSVEPRSLADEVQAHRPDVLVLDLSTDGGSGIDSIEELRQRAPSTQIVVLTAEDNPMFAQRAFTAGALGFVAGERVEDELPQAVCAAARGERYLSPCLTGQLESMRGSITADKLTPREVEVLRLIALGHTSVESARKLHLSPRTVETHRAHIHQKLGLSTRAELVRHALRRGLLGA